MIQLCFSTAKAGFKKRQINYIAFSGCLQQYECLLASFKNSMGHSWLMCGELNYFQQ